MKLFSLIALLFFAASCKTPSAGRDPNETPPPVQVDNDPDAIADYPARDCLENFTFDPKASVKITAFDHLIAKDETTTILKAKFERRLLGGANPDLDKKLVQFDGPGFSYKVTTDGDGIGSSNLNSLSNLENPTCFQASYGDHKMVGRIFRWNNNAPIFITDIDEVLSDLSEIRVPLTDNAKTPTLPGAPEALQQIARKHRIVYLTARDEALFNKTRDWLKLKGFPPGALLTWDWKYANRYGFSRSEQGKYKTQLIKDLQTKFSKIVAGVGNLPHDAKAFADVGILPVIISKDTLGFPSKTIIVQSWSDIPGRL